ncbi:MAG: hypothetical protein EPN62_00940 [Candidimonas sp.]|nr:MAG: hypothetical protein EPN77_01940 [Candidimonas sp.]TAM26893.1 MAG: hypothetical protein EPN62_00940 [Candidimonas sp.]
MTQATLSITTGRQLRDAGMQVAIDHAAAIDADWPARAAQALREFLFLNRDDFMAEDVRAYAYNELDVPQPPHDRAWGSIMAAAARQGLIHRVGIRPVRTASSHMANASVWRAA